MRGSTDAMDSGGMNGKTGEMLRWILGLALAAIVSYFTALGALQSKVAVVEEREQNHYNEVRRLLETMDIKLDRVIGGGR